MFNYTALTEGQILLFALILLRMIAFMVASAFFGSPQVGVQVKLLLSIVLSMILFPVVRAAEPNYLVIANEIVGLAIRELIVGLALGFLTRIFFFVIQFHKNTSN